MSPHDLIISTPGQGFVQLKCESDSWMQRAISTTLKEPCFFLVEREMGMGQNHVALVNPEIAGKWMFIPLKMYL